MAGNLSVPALLGAFLLCNLANLPGIIEGEGAATASGASADSRVIDTHIHIYDPARPAGIPWPPPDSELYRRCMPADFAAVAGPAGVTAAVIIEASTLVEDNQWVLDLMADEPSMVGFIGHLPLGSEDFARNLARFAANPRFVGVRRFILKEAALESEPVMTSLRDLQSRNLTLELVVIDRMRLGDAGAVAAALPNLRIVVDHVGGMPIQGTVPDSAWARDIRILGRHANVYLKISGLYQNTKRKPAPTDASYYAPTLDAVWEAFGEDRLLYGSNWPVTTLYGEYGPNVDIARSYFATRGPVVLEKVMWHNAVNAYNLALEN